MSDRKKLDYVKELKESIDNYKEKQNDVRKSMDYSFTAFQFARITGQEILDNIDIVMEVYSLREDTDALNAFARDISNYLIKCIEDGLIKFD